MWTDFNYAWGAMAGREAFEFGLESPERDMEATLMGWAASHPREVIELFNNPPEEWGGDRNRFARSIVAGIAQTDRTMATDLVYQLADEGNEDATSLMGRIAREALRTGGIDEASAWSVALADGPLKGAAMDRVAGSFVRQDPEGAASWVERFAEKDYAARAVREVGEEWAERDPLSAVTWLEGLPEGQGQSSGLNAAFGDWEDSDPAAAGEYLLAMRQSPQRDSAISGFSRGYAWEDPQTAIAWAQDISNPQLRERTLTQAGQAYMRRDPENARQWLANSGLSEEAQQEVVRGRRR